MKAGVDRVDREKEIEQKMLHGWIQLDSRTGEMRRGGEKWRG